MKKHGNICPDCGAWLDPGERCDCHEAAKELAQTIKDLSNRDLLRLDAFAKTLAGNQQARHQAAEQAAGA